MALVGNLCPAGLGKISMQVLSWLKPSLQRSQSCLLLRGAFLFMRLQQLLRVSRTAPLILLQGPSLGSPHLHPKATLGFERGASHSFFFFKAELILNKIIKSTISAFNSSRRQALPTGSFPCIDQKESMAGGTQKYLKVPVV